MYDYLLNTSDRHGEFVSDIIGSLYLKYLSRIRDKTLHFRHEEGALVHWGSKKSGITSLIDITQIADITTFLTEDIDNLEYVQPDFMLFDRNKYLKNALKTKTAGFPDLIIEIWSEGNDKLEISAKLELYQTSAITEHWYLHQNSNKVDCWLGEQKLPDQFLQNPLQTQGGLVFDLTHLAL